MRGKIDQIEEAILPKKKSITFKVGDTVAVHFQIKEGDVKRIQIFEGVVIAINGIKGSTVFTVRKVVQNSGVERMFPYYSSNVLKVITKKEGKVRRAKLYYLREKIGKKGRLKEVFLSEKGEAAQRERPAESDKTQQTTAASAVESNK